MKAYFVAAAALAMSAPALAAEHPTAGSHIDVYYSNLDVEVDVEGLGEDSVDGDGGGLRLWIGNNIGLFTVDVQANKLDGNVEGIELDGDCDVVRVGVGGRFINRPDAGLWLRAEYVRAQIDGSASFGGDDLGSASDKQEGFGIHAGGLIGHGMFKGYAEIGRLELEDLDGMEYTVGLNVQPGMIGGFVEYRYTDLELDDFDIDETYSDIRLGVRVGF